MTERERLIELARGNVERHLGDCESPDDIYEEVYTLAFDKLHDAGVTAHVAGEIASELAMSYAAP